MAFSTHIEVACNNEVTSTTARGALLEKLCSEILTILQFKVTEQVRLTGMEVDLIAQHETGVQKIFAECKAYRENISATVLQQLLGKLFLKDDINSVWLIATANLGKDAKGIWEEWKNSPDTHKKAKLVVYEPQALVQLLINVGKIIAPEKITLPNLGADAKYSESSTLLVTVDGMFWAFTSLNIGTGVPSKVHIYEAVSGKPVDNEELIQRISLTDNSLQELEWIIPAKADSTSAKKIEALDPQSIVKVPSGDSWDDYRPSRPIDFVGREEILKGIFSFLELVRLGQTDTRLVSIKSPSGWGKSSLLVKLADQGRSKKNQKKFYIYPVDTRAAVSPRYPELALVECLKAAVSDGFIRSKKGTISLGGINTPFEEAHIKQLLAKIKEENKVVVLFFDQFEEIFSKPELENLFKRFTELCNAVDAARENIVLGFSWKTDSTVPTDHQAYFMWNSLADRRKEFSIGMFNSKETSTIIGKFAKQLKQKIDPRLRRYLNDHCQGYPWLLKKLCIHVFKLTQQGKAQEEIVGQKLNIAELFKEETASLQPQEYACLEAIAKASPANFFEIHEIYGSSTIESLIDKRLVIRSATKLTLYWDIFRDFVLNKTVPNIPITYVPSYHVQAYTNALMVLMKDTPVTLDKFALLMEKSIRSTDNIVRDLVMLGNARRHGDIIHFANDSETDAVAAIQDFGRSHVFYRVLLEKYGYGVSFSNAEARATFISAYSTVFDDATLDGYVARMLGWFEVSGVLKFKNTGNELIVPNNAKTSLESILGFRRASVKSDIFLAPAPPETVLALLKGLKWDSTTLKITNLPQGSRNAIEAATSLRLIHKEHKNFVFNEAPPANLEDWLIKIATAHPSIQWAQGCLNNSSKKITGDEMGDLIVEKYGFENWSPGSKRRCGNSLKRWATWIKKKTTEPGLF